MFAQSSSPGDGIMEEDSDQQLTPTQDLNRATGRMLTLLQALQLGPTDAPKEQAQKASALLAREIHTRWRRQWFLWAPHTSDFCSRRFRARASTNSIWMRKHPHLFKHSWEKYQAEIAWVMLPRPKSCESL